MMKRYLELAPSTFYPKSPLQLFAGGDPKGPHFGSKGHILPGFLTRLVVLLDIFLVLCRLPENAIPDLHLRRSFDRPSQFPWRTTAPSTLNPKRVAGGFSALARDEIPHS